MTKRQPKGTPTGGQFAEGRKPEGDVKITDATDLNDGYAPEVVVAFEDIWAGNAQGFSHSDAINELARLDRLRAALGDGLATLRDVIGGSEPISDIHAADNWLDARTGETLRALATRGRSNRTNQVNVIKTIAKSTTKLTLVSQSSGA